jgi:hypothetical protein
VSEVAAGDRSGGYFGGEALRKLKPTRPLGRPEKIPAQVAGIITSCRFYETGAPGPLAQSTIRSS